MVSFTRSPGSASHCSMHSHNERHLLIETVQPRILNGRGGACGSLELYFPRYPRASAFRCFFYGVGVCLGRSARNRYTRARGEPPEEIPRTPGWGSPHTRPSASVASGRHPETTWPFRISISFFWSNTSWLLAILLRRVDRVRQAP